MGRFFIILALCLIPALSWGQVLALDARALFDKNVLNFKDEALTSSFAKTRFEFSGTAFMDRFRFKYAVAPGFSYSEQITTTKSLIIGATEFGNDPKEKSDKTKTVDLQWSTRGEQRIEVTLLRVARFQPKLLGEWVNLRIEATGKDKNGKVATDSEEASRFLAAFGGAYHYEAPRIIADISVAGGKDFNRFEAVMSYSFTNNLAVNAGYSNETRDLGIVKWRQHGVFVGGEWRF